MGAEDSETDDAALYAAEAGIDFGPVQADACEDPPPSSSELRQMLRTVKEERGSHVGDVSQVQAGVSLVQVGVGEGESVRYGPSPDDSLLRVYGEGRAEVLLVAFAGLMGGGGGVPHHEFVGACTRTGVSHALFLKDPLKSWYLFGLDTDDCASFDSVVQVIAAEVRALQPRRLVIVGVSMGAYAAVRAGVALGAAAVLALAPQVTIHLACECDIFESDLSAPYLWRYLWRYLWEVSLERYAANPGEILCRRSSSTPMSGLHFSCRSHKVSTVRSHASKTSALRVGSPWSH